MVRLSAKIAVLVALALIASSVQCAAACTPVACGDPPPPCHHHKKAPATPDTSCAHPVLTATIVQTSILSVALVAEAADSLLVPGAAASFEVTLIDGASPPGLHRVAPVVLRI